LQSDQNLPLVRFHCPRCHQAGTIPAEFRVRKARCGVCKLPLEAGPDDNLHGAKEATQMRRATAAAGLAATKTPSKFEQFFRSPNGNMRITNVVLVSIVAVGLIASMMVGAGALFASTPEGEVRAFTCACLAGDWNAAEEFLPENDDVARVEFERWRSFYFTSILDKHRPAGDKVSVTVEREGEDAASSSFVVTIKSKVIGQRILREQWRASDGRWRFDVVQTLAEMNEP
jgi:hypothetical protein